MSAYLTTVAPAIEMEIRGPGYDLSSLGWTVERMLIDECIHEAETGEVSPLKVLFDYWREKDWGHGAFDPLRELDITVQCVDVSGDNPLTFQFLNHVGKTFGSLAGMRIRELAQLCLQEDKEPLVRLADLISWEYAEVKKMRVPLYCQIDHWLPGTVHRRYTKLLLPPVGNRLYYATRLTAPLVFENPAGAAARR